MLKHHGIFLFFLNYEWSIHTLSFDRNIDEEGKKILPLNSEGKRQHWMECIGHRNYSDNKSLRLERLSIHSQTPSEYTVMVDRIWMVLYEQSVVLNATPPFEHSCKSLDVSWVP